MLSFLVVSAGTISFFPSHQPGGDGLGWGSRAGVSVLSPYKSINSKALGKDGILVCHDRAVMQSRAAE